jgi:hypothetical protein
MLPSAPRSIGRPPSSTNPGQLDELVRALLEAGAPRFVHAIRAQR